MRCPLKTQSGHWPRQSCVTALYGILCRSLHLDAGSLDHLGPLLGRFDNKCGELGLCADEWNVAQLNRPRAELRICNASVNFAMQSFYDFK
jgi:hypothetical protein